MNSRRDDRNGLGGEAERSNEDVHLMSFPSTPPTPHPLPNQSFNNKSSGVPFLWGIR